MNSSSSGVKLAIDTDFTLCGGFKPRLDNKGELFSQMPKQEANIECSPVRDTSYLAELIYDLINRQLICRKFPNPVKTQYLQKEMKSCKF